MVKRLRVRRPFLMGNGVLMLCLGMALCSLGTVMANPVYDELGYAIAVALTVLCFVAPHVYLKMPANGAGHSRPATIYLLIGASSLAG